MVTGCFGVQRKIQLSKKKMSSFFSGGGVRFYLTSPLMGDPSPKVISFHRDHLALCSELVKTFSEFMPIRVRLDRMCII